jgi:hypothetical protein
MRAALALLILTAASLLVVALDPATDWSTGRGSIQHGRR